MFSCAIIPSAKQNKIGFGKCSCKMHGNRTVADDEVRGRSHGSRFSQAQFAAEIGHSLFKSIQLACRQALFVFGSSYYGYSEFGFLQNQLSQVSKSLVAPSFSLKASPGSNENSASFTGLSPGDFCGSEALSRTNRFEALGREYL